MIQRRYKAKAAHKDEWVFGYYLEVGGVPFILPEGKPINEIVQVRPDTVCMGAEIPSKNGEEIFEGDIISIFNPRPFAPWICEVVYKDCCWWLYGKSQVGNVMLTDYKNESLEVIGNIHDKEDSHA